MTTKPRGRAFRRQFLLLSRKRRGLEAARRIFLVQSQRNQWLSRFACTKAAVDFEPRGAFSWCKTYAINSFPGLLAPSPPPISSRAVHFLGARPTQSMAFPGCLHQVPRRFQTARRIFLVQSQRNQWLSRVACTKSPAGFSPPPISAGAPPGTRATSSAAFPSPWCAFGIPVSAFRLLPCASVLRSSASSPRNRRSPGALS